MKKINFSPKLNLSSWYNWLSKNLGYLKEK